MALRTPRWKGLDPQGLQAVQAHVSVTKLIGVHKTMIQNWKTSRFAPKLDFMPRTIQFLGIHTSLHRPSLSG